ncbi:tetratricopeptide repeat protein [Mucilaginibacter sp. PAMB04274]|uniref:tetratricopeptide repeat-containing sensor histidine kinase n=1 Tax=Mucilaginibacter sp. PAMB04274 TaxID=3138568 RepID=UPI0031F708A1
MAVCLALTTVSRAQKTLSTLLIDYKFQKDSQRIVTVYEISEHYKYLKPDSATLYAQRGLLLSKKLNYSYGAGILNRLLGEIDMNQGKVAQAKLRFQSALNSFKAIGNPMGMASIYNDLGLLAGRQGKYKEATPLILQALTVFEKLKDTSGIIQCYIKLGSINLETERLDKALFYYHKGMVLARLYPKSNTVASLLNNIGSTYLKKNSYQKALIYFNEGLKTVADSQRIDVHMELLNNASGVYQKLGDKRHALAYAHQALSLARRGNFREQEASILVTLSSLLRQNRPDSSIILLDRALKITRAIHQPYLRLDVYQGMVDLYKQNGRYKEAERILEARDVLKDSLFTLKQSKEIADLQSSYDLARSTDKVQQLNKNNVKINYYKNIILVIAIGVLISLIFVLFLYRKTRNLNRELIQQKEVLHQQKEELDKENNFKDKLFSIIGHDLRSPISTLVNLMEIAEEDELSAEEFQSLIPQLMGQSKVTLETLDKLLIWGKSKLKDTTLNKSHFNAKELITKNIALYQNAALQKGIRMSDNTPDELWLVADSAQVDFVIRNLLANAIKYTDNGGKIEVTANLNHPNGFNAIIINDNGVGIDDEAQQHIFERDNVSKDGTAQEKGNSIGLMLCKEFVKENKGRIDLRSQLGRGTQFTVSIPCL